MRAVFQDVFYQSDSSRIMSASFKKQTVSRILCPKFGFRLVSTCNTDDQTYYFQFLGCLWDDFSGALDDVCPFFEGITIFIVFDRTFDKFRRVYAVQKPGS